MRFNSLFSNTSFFLYTSDFFLQVVLRAYNQNEKNSMKNKSTEQHKIIKQENANKSYI